MNTETTTLSTDEFEIGVYCEAEHRCWYHRLLRLRRPFYMRKRGTWHAVEEVAEAMKGSGWHCQFYVDGAKVAYP